MRHRAVIPKRCRDKTLVTQRINNNGTPHSGALYDMLVDAPRKTRSDQSSGQCYELMTILRPV